MRGVFLCFTCLAGTAAGLVASTGAVGAQETQNSAGAEQAPLSGLKDIVVTARKREESLMSVPVAVSAISGATLERAGATNLSQISQLAPQIQMYSGTTGATFAIRGLGSSLLDTGLEQTVSVNIDGVQVGRGRIINTSFFDIAQTEVLKGPQALFFGKNSPAGVVSIRSRGPGDELEGYLRGGYEFNARERYVEAAAGGPLTETLGVRLAGRASKMSGYLINDAQAGPWFWDPTLTNPGAPYRREPRTKSIQGRLTAVWEPTDAFNMTLKVAGGNYKDSGSGGSLQLICATGSSPIVIDTGRIAPGFPPAPVFDPYSDCGLNKHKASGSIPAEIAATFPGARGTRTYTDQDTLVSSLTATYATDNVSITSVTGYYYIDSGGTLLPTYDSLSVTAAYVAEHNNTFTQELRAVTDFDMPLNFTVGGYFESVKSKNAVNALLFYAGPDPATGNSSTTGDVARNNNRTYSLFGQARWNILENLELAGGLRWTRERKRTENVNEYLHAAAAGSGGFVPEGVILSSRITDENVSPEVTLTWHPVSNATVYAAYKTGYKSGGISNPTLLTAGFNTQNLTFSAEKAKGFEVGAKGYLFNRMLRLELTGYRYDYDDLQVSAFDSNTLSFLIQNAASARIQGIEAAVEWRALPELTLQASVGYNHARYRSYPDAPCGLIPTGPCATGTVQDLSGEPLAHAPDWSGSVTATYDTAIGSNLRVGVNGGIDYSSKYFTQENNDPLAVQKSYARFNAGVRVYTEDEKWELALIGRNLTNKYVLSYTTDTVFGPNGVYSAGMYRPREINLQGTFRF